MELRGERMARVRNYALLPKSAVHWCLLDPLTNCERTTKRCSYSKIGFSCIPGSQAPPAPPIAVLALVLAYYCGAPAVQSVQLILARDIGKRERRLALVRDEDRRCSCFGAAVARYERGGRAELTTPKKLTHS